jgi:hypothetical protein
MPDAAARCFCFCCCCLLLLLLRLTLPLVVVCLGVVLEELQTEPVDSHLQKYAAQQTSQPIHQGKLSGC